MQIVNTPIEQVIPYANNPRHNDTAVPSLANSIKEFGFKQPIMVDKDMVVITGHTRLKAARLLGLAEVPVIVVTDLTPAQVKAYRIADNKVGELADWDTEALQKELADLQIAGMDLSWLDFPDEGELQITELPVLTPPKMAWALIGIPLERYLEIAEQIEKLGKIENIYCEVVLNDDPKNRQ
jgi:ParB-like chromosome segregation protein Spo0J